MNERLDYLKAKAIYLHELRTNEQKLFEVLNSESSKAKSVFEFYKPSDEFKPVKMLRFLIANELIKGKSITKVVLDDIKKAIEARNVTEYFDLNDSVQKSLTSYKQSKVGMFPNWTEKFKVLFPFIYSEEENLKTKEALRALADNLIAKNNLSDVNIHTVSFQGSQNYGDDHAWAAIIPKSAPNVQRAYQLFFVVDYLGLESGIHKGARLLNKETPPPKQRFSTWNEHVNHATTYLQTWNNLNSDVDFEFQKDERVFRSLVNKMSKNSIGVFFGILDQLTADLKLEDTDNLVFSTSSGQLSFQIGKRFCINLKKSLFDFITSNDYSVVGLSKETFTAPSNAILYHKADSEIVIEHYTAIKQAVDSEIERDNHTEAKSYDNASFRKAVFEPDYRAIFLKTVTSLSFNENNTILLNDEMIYKISMGPDYFSEEDISDAINKKLVIVHSDTKPKGRSNKSQAEIFEKDMQIGDYFYLTRGNKGIKILGKITSNAIPASFKELYNEGWLERSFEIIQVSKNNNPYKGIGKYWTPNTVTTCYPVNLTEISQANELIFEPFFNLSFQKNTSMNKLNENEKIKNNKNYRSSLNQIFYGPPGTGKTYNSILEAAKIIKQDDALGYSDALDIFNIELKNRIEFITFHQNYSYEDFIQGLRPDIEQKALSFNRADGVFAKVATNALFEYYKIFQKKQIKTTNSTDIKIDLNDAFIEFMNSLEEGQEFESKTGRIIKVDSFTDRQNIEFKPTNGVKSYLVSGDRLLKLYKEFDDIDKIKRVHDDIRGAIGGCNSTIYYVALREFIEFLKEYNKDVEEFSDTDDEYNYEDITYRRKKELLSNFSIEDIKSVSENEVPNYVIIIDEINRANISRVFGELITLIEKDKRSHGKIPIRATLPSGEQFIVPSNLHIIGTMNTADKSIALLDIALRRRFEFKAMYPKYSIDGKEVHKASFLENLNKLIVASGKGHDFTIGHSYFMADDSSFNFKNVINNKVIPLLLEYYMNDEIEVTKILNEALKEEHYKIANWPLEIVSND
ncbi:McrB family protein [Patiriisocius marinus]|uniref:McrB family protein n=1 Tax=Patiriisocius marinus TaxID=1397112 RepID=UPI00232BB59E|nr:AAA family ATPase [Patiriisocius marinus]